MLVVKQHSETHFYYQILVIYRRLSTAGATVLKLSSSRGSDLLKGGFAKPYYTTENKVGVYNINKQ